MLEHFPKCGSFESPRRIYAEESSAFWPEPDLLNKVPAQNKGHRVMKLILQAAFVIGIGLLASACDKCGNWNINTPKICHGSGPQG